MFEMMNKAIMKRTTNDTAVVMFTILDALVRKFITLLSWATFDTPEYVATSAHTVSATEGSARRMLNV